MTFIYHKTYEGPRPTRKKRKLGDQYTVVVYGLPERPVAGTAVKAMVGVALCHPDDHFDPDVGKMLADAQLQEVTFEVEQEIWEPSTRKQPRVYELFAPGITIDYTWETCRPSKIVLDIGAWTRSRNTVAGF